MAKRLYLLRHAQAASALSGEDKDRPLSPHGIEQAKTVGAHIGNVDLALCSSAQRTQMTLQNALEGGGNIDRIQVTDALYNASAGDLLYSLQEQDVDNLLIVAHNPGIHMLAQMLVGGGNEFLIEKINLFYNPATLSILYFDIKDWNDIQPQSGTLVDLIIPE